MPRITDKNAMRRRILEAALARFAEGGFHATKMENVAEAAGLAKGTLYLYFKSKEALAVALASHLFSQMEERFLLCQTPRTRQEFAAILDQTMGLALETMDATRIYFEVMAPSFSNPEVVATMRSFFDRLASLYAEQIAGLQERGEVRADLDPGAFSRALVAMIDGLVIHRALVGIDDAKYVRIRQETMRFVERGLAPD